MSTETKKKSKANVVAELERLSEAALSNWNPRTLAGRAARDTCRASWSNAVALSARGAFSEARSHLDVACAIAEREGGGAEENEALRLLAPDTRIDAPGVLDRLRLATDTARRAAEQASREADHAASAFEKGTGSWSDVEQTAGAEKDAWDDHDAALARYERTKGTAS